MSDARAQCPKEATCDGWEEEVWWPLRSFRLVITDEESERLSSGNDIR